MAALCYERLLTRPDVDKLPTKIFFKAALAYRRAGMMAQAEPLFSRFAEQLRRNDVLFGEAVHLHQDRLHVRLDAGTLQIALTAANRLTHEILEGLSANDLRAACTNAIIAHPMGIIQGVDHLFTGKVERVDTELLQTLLNQEIIPVVPPLGFDGDGKTYRVNSDSVAVAVADALKASKLIFITTQEGVICQGHLIRQLLVADLDALLADPCRRLLRGHRPHSEH